MAITVIKIPRPDMITDKPASFKKLENLHLELLENKNKLKKNLPPLIIKKVIPKGESSKTEPSPSKREPPPPSKSERKTIPTTAETASVASQEDIVLKTLGGGSLSGDEELEHYESIRDESVREESIHEGTIRDESIFEGSNHEGSVVESVSSSVSKIPSDENTEEYKKQELIWKFRNLKKAYKTREDIPDYNEHDDYNVMNSHYKNLLRDIKLDENLKNYRTYLMIGFFGVEYLGKFIGVDLSGFAAQQIQTMDEYETLLIELGEKSETTWTSNLPVEARIIGMVFFQAAVFWLLKSVGGPAASMLSIVLGKKPPSVQETQPIQEEKKMKGPSILRK